MKHPAASILATCLLTTRTSAGIQITQPAPKAVSLPLNPPPQLRWVYGSDDPPVIGIIIGQVESDTNARDIGLYRGGTPTELGSLQLDFTGSELKPGMNITIAIVDPSENPLAVGRQPVLDTVGPLLLEDARTGRGSFMSATTGFTSVSNATSYATSAKIGPTTNGTNTSRTIATTTPAIERESTTKEPDRTMSGSDTTTAGLTSGLSESASASDTATTTSAAVKLLSAANIYMGALIVLGLPAFVRGINS